MNKISENKKLMQRFCKDYNLPINVFNEEMFSYYMELYDFFPRDTWNRLCNLIEEKYDGNVDLWLDYCANVRDAAIFGVMGTDEYKEFNTRNMDDWNIPSGVPNIGEHSIFNMECVGKDFVSIDMKKANFQALKWAGVIHAETYDEFIRGFGGDDYIAGSKYLRQVIFGKMNPGRTIKVEKYLMGNIHLLINGFFESKGYEFYSFNSDELIYKKKDAFSDYHTSFKSEDAKHIEDIVMNNFGIEVRVEHVLVGNLGIVNSNGNNVDAYLRLNLDTMEEKLKKASTTFYPQIYKLWKRQPIDEVDRVFFFEDQLATFNEPLRYADNS